MVNVLTIIVLLVLFYLFIRLNYAIHLFKILSLVYIFIYYTDLQLVK